MRIISNPTVLCGHSYAPLPRLHHTRFGKAPDAAKRLVSTGASTRGRDLEPTKLAAWTAVTQAILNLDEAIARR